MRILLAGAMLNKEISETRNCTERREKYTAYGYTHASRFKFAHRQGKNGILSNTQK